jgi:putative flavoprotein involved in K+ transport
MTTKPLAGSARVTDVVIIGAGQAGLAMSSQLTDRSIEHVLLERGETANSWRTERWDSLRMLTPNWMSRLPDWTYGGDDPDGYMTALEVATHLEAYRESFAAPVLNNTAVHNVTSTDQGFVTLTSQGEWRSRAVVIASGACGTPRIPSIGAELPAHITQIAPIHYRNPAQLEDGGVLVVGASASGAQIADELRRSGREVTLAVGDHVRLPRTYRGMDIHWWMETLGLLGERFDEVEDLNRARRLPSLQLVGSPSKRTLDLNSLQNAGVELTGRLVGFSNGKAQFSGSFTNMCAAADLKQGRLLDEIDLYSTQHNLDSELESAIRPERTRARTPRNVLDLSHIKTVVWATGFRPDYPWLEPHLLDAKGAIRHEGGVMDEPGMYVLGLTFMRRRNSSFIDGVGADARDLSTHLAGHLDNLAVSEAADRTRSSSPEETTRSCGERRRGQVTLKLTGRDD